MAIEYVELNVMSGGSKVAVDTIATLEYQIMKIALGADGALDNLLDAGQQVMAASLPVVLASDQSDITVALSTTDNAVLDTIDAVLDAINAKLTTGTVIGDVNLGATDNAVLDAIVALLTTIDTDTGNLAAIKTAVEVLDNAISGSEMQVDVITVPAPLSTTGGGTEATALRVTLANDSTGIITIDDGGGAITVDGTVAVTNGGTFVVQENGAALTALQLLDNIVYSEDIATPATIVGAAVLMERDDVLSALTPVAGDWAGLRCSAEGALWVQDFNSDAILADTTAIKTAVEGTLMVDLGANNDVTVTSGTITANLGATDNAVLDTIDAVLDTINAKLVTGTVIGDVNLGAIDNAVLDQIATAVEVIDNAISGSEMQIDVVAALPTGANTVGDVGISGARTSGGTTLYKNIDVDESEDQVKGTAGQVYWIHAINLKASVLYLKLYNATAANVTVGTTVPDLTFPVPTQGDTNGAGFTLSIPNGIAFGTAITVAATTGVADNDSGAPGANEMIVNLGYA